VTIQLASDLSHTLGLKQPVERFKVQNHPVATLDALSCYPPAGRFSRVKYTLNACNITLQRLYLDRINNATFFNFLNSLSTHTSHFSAFQ